MAFEQVEILVDLVDQTELLGQQVDGSDASRRDGASPLGGLVMDLEAVIMG
jgi:hypothetical protein